MSNEIKSRLEINIKSWEDQGCRCKNFSGGIAENKIDKLIRLKDIDGKKGIVSFYFSVFGNKDSDGDILQKGAFKKTIAENFSRMKHLLDHDRTIAPGVLKEIHEDDYGTYAVSQLMPTIIGKDTLIMYEYGAITEHSMGFGVLQEHYDEMQKANIITEVKLWEVSSLQTWGANPMTKVNYVKEEDVDLMIANLETILKSSAISDEKGKELEATLKVWLKARAEKPVKKSVNWGEVLRDLQN